MSTVVWPSQYRESVRETGVVNDVNGTAAWNRSICHSQTSPVDCFYEQTPVIYGRSMRILSCVLNPNFHPLDCLKEKRHTLIYVLAQSKSCNASPWRGSGSQRCLSAGPTPSKWTSITILVGFLVESLDRKELKMRLRTWSESEQKSNLKDFCAKTSVKLIAIRGHHICF